MYDYVLLENKYILQRKPVFLKNICSILFILPYLLLIQHCIKRITKTIFNPYIMTEGSYHMLVLQELQVFSAV